VPVAIVAPGFLVFLLVRLIVPPEVTGAGSYDFGKSVSSTRRSSIARAIYYLLYISASRVNPAGCPGRHRVALDQPGPLLPRHPRSTPCRRG